MSSDERGPGRSVRRLILPAVLLVMVVALFRDRWGSADGVAALLVVLPSVAVLVVAFVGIKALVRWWAVRRGEAAREWAARVGWRYVGTDPSLARRWSGAPFDGEPGEVDEACVGAWQGRPAVSFCYRRWTGSGDDRSRTAYHVVAMTLPVPLPSLELTPENGAVRVLTGPGARDHDLESVDFNREWRVNADDPRFAHAVLQPRLMERLLAPDVRGLSWRLEGADVLCWSRGEPDLDAVARRLAVLAAIVDAIPRFVWLDHGHDPATT